MNLKSNQIAAVVVTFNRIDFLKKIIESLRTQSKKIDKIFVVNNSSSDGTEEWLNLQEDLFVIKQGNFGSSGGQFTGWFEAYNQGYEWLWIMDDDVVPRKDCLEVLFKSDNNDLIRVPTRINPDGNYNLSDIVKTNLINPFKSIWDVLTSKELIEAINSFEIQGLTFEGPLIHRKVITKVGLPEFDFFIYADDTEYSMRIINSGFKIELYRNAIIDRLLPVPNLSSEFNWKTYYIIRNIIACDVLNSPFHTRCIRPFGYVISWLLKCKRINDYKIVFKAFYDGYFYTRSKKNVDFINQQKAI